MPSISRGGCRIYYEVFGDGEPVVFLNGVLMTVQSWVLQTSVLRRTRRCVMHDFRGQLLSDKPSERWSFDDHVEDLRLVLDELEIGRCHLIGTSYGGEVGLMFALRYPERLGSLAVISSVSEVDSTLDEAVSTWQRAAIETPERLYRVSVPFNYSSGFIAANEDLLEQGEERLAGYPQEFFPALAKLIDAFRVLDITEEIGSINCPTLVMVGALDTLKPPRWSRLIAERIERSEFVVVPDAGHAVIIEKPDEVNAALLDFLERHCLEAP